MVSAPRRALVVLVLVLLSLPGASAGAKRPITETDLFKFVWIADPQISPDGRQTVFVRVNVNEKRDGYETALWIVPTDGSEPPRPFTSGPGDNSPRWSPDSTRVVFVRAAPKGGGKPGEGKPAPPQLYLISIQGGEAVALTDLPGGAGAPAWSPDGKTIAFASETLDEDLEKASQGKDEPAKSADKSKKTPEEDRKSDVRVITRAVYRFNGPGYLDFTHPGHIWTVEVPAASAKASEPKRLTSGELGTGDPVWSPDGKQIYFAANRVKEPYYENPDGDVYAVPAKGGEIRRIVSIDGPIGDFTVSPDGRRVAFVGNVNPNPARSHNQPDLFVADATPGSQARNLTQAYDWDVIEGLAADQHAPRGGRPQPLVWSRDGRSIYAAAGERGRVNLQRFDAETGTASPLTQGDQEVVSYTATPDASRMAVVVSTPLVINDLFALDTATGKMTAIGRPNQELFSELDLTAPEEITYKSFDGKEIHAFVQRPPSFNPRKKYPLILNIHGGPHSAYGFAFFHEMQWMAAKGYVVLYPNPRGSSTYGQEFGNVIQYEFPGDDAKDLLAGVDEMVKRGSIDPERLGVTGGSGGGILTNWIITQTGRFKAAVSQRSIADWSSFWYTADFTLFQPTWFKGAPWEDPQDYARRSPITHANKITTPLMLIEGEEDYRTPPAAGGEMMFRALKYLKKPVVMVRFPGESHDLSRSGQPWHRVERLRHITAWFDKYLQGKKIDTYDVPEAGG